MLSLAFKSNEGKVSDKDAQPECIGSTAKDLCCAPAGSCVLEALDAHSQNHALAEDIDCLFDGEMCAVTRCPGEPDSCGASSKQDQYPGVGTPKVAGCISSQKDSLIDAQPQNLASAKDGDLLFHGKLCAVTKCPGEPQACGASSKQDQFPGDGTPQGAGSLIDVQQQNMDDPARGCEISFANLCPRDDPRLRMEVPKVVRRRWCSISPTPSVSTTDEDCTDTALDIQEHVGDAGNSDAECPQDGGSKTVRHISSALELAQCIANKLSQHISQKASSTWGGDTPGCDTAVATPRIGEGPSTVCTLESSSDESQCDEAPPGAKCSRVAIQLEKHIPHKSSSQDAPMPHGIDANQQNEQSTKHVNFSLHEMAATANQSEANTAVRDALELAQHVAHKLSQHIAKGSVTQALDADPQIKSSTSVALQIAYRVADKLKQIEARTCTDCGSMSPAGFNFCVECGLKITMSCDSCGEPLSGAKRFCVKCGHKTGGIVKATSPRSASETCKSADHACSVQQTPLPARASLLTPLRARAKPFVPRSQTDCSSCSTVTDDLPSKSVQQTAPGMVDECFQAVHSTNAPVTDDLLCGLVQKIAPGMVDELKKSKMISESVLLQAMPDHYED